LEEKSYTGKYIKKILAREKANVWIFERTGNV
jgi:hypothetical protein